MGNKMDNKPDINNIEVKHNAGETRFEVQLGDKMAFIEYDIAGNNMVFTHTEVPPEFEGKGIAAKMAKVALDYALEKGHKIQAFCPYVKGYVERHPEYQPHTWGYS
jgi:uncharacterized protein